jgi:flagellar biosynthesis GTPase FlhF
MARRKRSYGLEKNNGAIFLNNCLASHQKAQKEAEKEAAASRRRSEREADSERKRREREAKSERKRAEKEAEKARKEQAKLDEKVEKVYVRLESDIKKMGLYPGEGFLAKTAEEAVKLSISVAQAKKYFVSDVEDKVARECAKEFLWDKEIIYPEEWDEYDALVALVTGYRPQQDAAHDDKFTELEGKLKRREERDTLISELLDSKIMFGDDIEEFAEIIEANDWGKSDCENSADYTRRVQNKSDYVMQVKAQIRTIKLAVAN